MSALTVVLRVAAGHRQVVGAAVRSVLASTHPAQALILAVDHPLLTEMMAGLPGETSAALPVERVAVDPGASSRAVWAACLGLIRTPLVLSMSAREHLGPTLIEKAIWALASQPTWSFLSAGPGPHDNVPAALAQHLTDPGDILPHLHRCPVRVFRLTTLRQVLAAQPAGPEPESEWEDWLRLAAAGHWGGTLAERLVTLALTPDADAAREPDAAARARMRQRYPALWAGRFAAVVRQPSPVPVSVGRPARADAPWVDSRPAQAAHLLLVVPWFSLGGVDRYNLTLMAGLKQRGWSLTVCATTRGPHDWVDDYTAVTADCFILPHFLPARNQPAFLSHLIGSRGASHVLITHAMLGYRLLPYLRARHPQVTFVDYNHMVASDWPSGGYPGQGARAQTLLDLNIVSSDMVRRWMIAQGAEAARIAVSYTGVDTTIWDPGRFDRQGLRRQHGVHDQRPVLIFAGRLVAQKRPERFIEIVRGLKARGLGFEAWIVGDGPLTPKIERAIRHAGLQGTVRLLGTRPADEVPALLAAGDVLVLPSLNEGIALILFEAMALGLPVVSADVGGQRELVGPEAGILIAPNRGELEAYIDAVAGLLVDPARRAQMGAAARQRVASRFDLADTLTQMEGLLQRAAELAAAAPRQPPTPDEAERLAIDVIADLEYDRLQEQLRVPDATRAASGWRARLAHVVKLWVLRPAYYWGLRQGIPGLDQAATWAFERLRWLLG